MNKIYAVLGFEKIFKICCPGSISTVFVGTFLLTSRVSSFPRTLSFLPFRYSMNWAWSFIILSMTFFSKAFWASILFASEIIFSNSSAFLPRALLRDLTKATRSFTALLLASFCKSLPIVIGVAAPILVPSDITSTWAPLAMMAPALVALAASGVIQTAIG